MMRKLGLLILLVSMLLVGLPTDQPQSAEAQASYLLTNYVLYNFSNYAGISPVLTASELELGNPNRPFEAGYTVAGLDLRQDPLSCSSPVLDEGELITNGQVGYRYLITLSNFTYEFRINLAGTQLIRCYYGRQIDFNGAPRGIGTTISGDRATDLAFTHAQNYLGLDVPVSTAKANDPDEDTPYLYYRWNSYMYLDASLACPQYGAQYDVRDTFAFRVILNVAGYYFDYRVRGDGAVVLLCQGGRPNTSSIGLELGQITATDTES